MPHYADLGAQLLRDAATFFRTLASENPEIRIKMLDNAAAFEAAAQRLLENPHGQTGDKAHVDVAAKFLNEAAAQRLLENQHGQTGDKAHVDVAAKFLNEAAMLFRRIGEQNEPIREQMLTNADTFDQIAAKLRLNPMMQAD